MAPLNILLLVLISLPTGLATQQTEPDSEYSPATNPSGPTMTVWSPVHNSGNITDPGILPGTDFPVSVNIINAAQYTAYIFSLEYNPAVLELVNATFQGTVFYLNPRASSIYPQSLGVLGVYAESFTPAQGNGTLLNTYFRAKQTSLTSIRITNSILTLDNIPIAHQNRQGCFNNRTPIIPTIDFTNDPSPGYYDTSRFMAGRVAVGIILPESDGSHYNWTDAEVNQTITGIRDGMNWWASQNPGADLTFYYNTHIRVPTTYEPIETPIFDSVWIAEVMNQLGYPGDPFTATSSYNNEIRNANKTDWAFTIFVADSDPYFNQGLFVGGGYAYAYIGGPFMVMSRYSTWAYNSGEYFQAVPAHETGHIFGASDEYNYFLEYSGYLSTPDADGSFGIMNQNNLKLSASTEAQIGQIDCDGNGVPDVLETPPGIMVVPPAATITNPLTTITGKAVAVPYPAYDGGRSVTIGKIVSVQYRVDRGPWLNTIPRDGVFNGALEDFAFNLTNPPGGLHTIYVTATGSQGQTSTTSFTINVPVGTPSFTKWAAKPAYRRLDLAKTSQQLLLAHIKVTGATAYVYVQFRITGGNGSTYTVLSQVSQINAGNETILQSAWTPPSMTARYRVSATIYYSPWPGEPSTPDWTIGPNSEFTFQVSV